MKTFSLALFFAGLAAACESSAGARVPNEWASLPPTGRYQVSSVVLSDTCGLATPINASTDPLLVIVAPGSAKGTARANVPFIGTESVSRYDLALTVGGGYHGTRDDLRVREVDHQHIAVAKTITRSDCRTEEIVTYALVKSECELPCVGSARYAGDGGLSVECACP